MKNPYCSLIIFMLFSLLSCRNTPIEHNSKMSDNSKIDSILLTHFYENIIDYNNIDWKDYIKEESKYLDSLYFIVYETSINGYEVKVRLSHLSDSFEGFTGMATIYFKRNNSVINLLHPTFYIEDSLFSKLSTHRIDTINYTFISFGNEINNELGQFKDVPFAFYDVDFDGEKEVLLRNPSIGQRGSNGYRAYKIPQNENPDFEEVTLYDSLREDNDFPILDDYTEFDFKNKNIIVRNIGGHDDYSEEIYSVKDGQITRIN